MGILKIFDFLPSQGDEQTVSFDLIPSPCLPSTTSRPLPVQSHVSVSFPLEVIISILEEAAAARNKDVLLASSLVCRAWSPAAQRLLFKKVVLRSKAAFSSFCQAIDHSTLGDAVSSLRVVLDHNQPDGVTPSMLARAITSCSNLQEVSISLYGPTTRISQQDHASRIEQSTRFFDDDVLLCLKDGPAPRSLNFSNWSNDNQALFQLLDIWPELRSLSISGNTPSLPSPSSEPYTGSIERLTMNVKTSPSTTFLKWLLNSSTDSLVNLRFAREPQADVIEYMMEVHGSRLQSLSLPSWSSTNASLLERCSSLKSIATESSMSSPIAFKYISDGIEHVAFGMDQDASLAPILELVRSRRSLKTVTIQAWNMTETTAGAVPHSQLSSLKMACAYRGIELDVTKCVADFRAMTNGGL